MNGGPLVIRGGAGVYEAAAIAAVIQHILDEEAAARSRPPTRNTQTAWVRIGAPSPFGRFTPPVVPDPGVRRG